MPSATMYAPVFSSAFTKKIDLLTDVIKGSLHTTTYTPDTDLHDFQNDLTNEAPATGGYTTGGVIVGGAAGAAPVDTFTYTNATNTWMYDAPDISWTSSTITARYLVLYDSSPGTAATNPLICLFDFDTNQSTSNGTFSIAFNAAGLFTIVS
jgi:hypothetical protein